MSGMEVDIDDQLMEKLLQQAVTGVGVPYTYIDATNEVEFARSLSMQNQGFVKKIVNLQEAFGTYFTGIISAMYGFEYGRTEHDKRRDSRIAKANQKKNKDPVLDTTEDIDHERITIIFPEPVLLSVGTSNEQIEQTSTTIDYIAELYMGEEAEENNIRTFKRRLAKDVFLKNLDWDKYDQAFKDAQKDMTRDQIDKEVSNINKSDDEDSGSDEPMY